MVALDGHMMEIITRPYGRRLDPRAPTSCTWSRLVAAFRSKIDLEPDDANGLSEPSAGQCQQVRAVSIDRLGDCPGGRRDRPAPDRRELADLLDL
jgi:hypothetical protein